MGKKIIFTTGGTGGHVLPATDMMKHFSELGYDVVLVTDKRGKNFLKGNSRFETYIINTGTPTNKKIFKKVLSLLLIFFSILKSALIIIKEKPNLIFGFGSYVSFPISLVSKILNVPLVIYENNLAIGRANKILIKFAKKIFLGKSFSINLSNNYKDKISVVGPILRKEIVNYEVGEKASNNKIFSILVLGGSQGAKVFGEKIPGAIKMIKENGHEISINQQCLEYQKNELINFYNKHNIKNNIFSFTNDILNLISSSDLAISRSGATTIAELTHILTPFIAVPLPESIDDHQLLNANYYNSLGCCWVMEQNKLDEKNLFNLIIEIIKDKQKLNNFRENMKKNRSKNVYKKIEEEIKKII
jgi:UDP-N-acetylglucosamine--N-acetylmuramyl-(pentapeptide) pyrophosphoryl-undecaprenol N-acetylglucosamine transferase